MVKTPEKEFIERIGKGLGRAYRETLPHFATVDARTAKIILFSDHHRGLRNGADDFRLSEQAYHAALAYYFNMGYTLILLGDVEELWEEHPEPVVEKNKYSFSLERQFHEANGQRYFRLWGNHDDEWRDENRVQKLLQKYYGTKPLQVREGLHLVVKDEGRELGRIFLTHGHQGTKDSDFQLNPSGNQTAGMAKWAVHNLLRNFQRITKIPTNTPARDFDLTDRHDLAMYAWAAAQKGRILITGHTHKPVFAAEDYLTRLTRELATVENEWRLLPENLDLQTKLSEISAEIEWLKARQKKAEDKPGLGLNPKPCYFNTGCCSFSDGDVTGIEIAEGMIRLVRWPDDNGKPLPKILQERDLRGIFAELQAAS
jgi:predicted phosphodiesterase